MILTCMLGINTTIILTSILIILMDMIRQLSSEVEWRLDREGWRAVPTSF